MWESKVRVEVAQPFPWLYARPVTMCCHELMSAHQSCLFLSVANCVTLCYSMHQCSASFWHDPCDTRTRMQLLNAKVKQQKTLYDKWCSQKVWCLWPRGNLRWPCAWGWEPKSSQPVPRAGPKAGESHSRAMSSGYDLSCFPWFQLGVRGFRPSTASHSRKTRVPLEALPLQASGKH